MNDADEKFLLIKAVTDKAGRCRAAISGMMADRRHRNRGPQANLANRSSHIGKVVSLGRPILTYDGLSARIKT